MTIMSNAAIASLGNLYIATKSIAIVAIGAALAVVVALLMTATRRH